MPRDRRGRDIVCNVQIAPLRIGGGATGGVIVMMQSVE